MGFFGVCVVVLLARRPTGTAPYLIFFLLLPLMVGGLGVITKCVSALASIAQADADMKPLYIAAAVSTTLRMLTDALVVTIPSAIVTAIGLLVRTFHARKQPSRRPHNRLAAR